MHQQKSSRGKVNDVTIDGCRHYRCSQMATHAVVNFTWKGKARMKKTVATEPQDDDHTTRGKQYDTPG